MFLMVLIIKELPVISQELSKNISNQEIHNIVKFECKDVLKKSDYGVDLKYTNNQSHEQTCDIKISSGLTKPLLTQFQQTLTSLLSIGKKAFSNMSFASQNC